MVVPYPRSVWKNCYAEHQVPGKTYKYNFFYPVCFAEKLGNRDYLLTIDYATMDEDAEYTVIARNVAGEARGTAQLLVEPKTDSEYLEIITCKHNNVTGRPEVPLNSW